MSEHLLPAANPSSEMLNFLSRRRSTPIRMLEGPGPDEVAIQSILRIAQRVPDHRKVGPWRFIIVDSVEGFKLGHMLAEAQISESSETPNDDELEKTRHLFNRAPVCIAVVSSPDMDHKTPVWEQELSVGAVCFNLLLAANAMGWAGSWLTEWPAFSPAAARLLGLSDEERIAGFIHLGTAKSDVPERLRPDLESRVTTWRSPNT